MRAVIYTRISEDKTGAAAGVARQEADCRALCDRRGWKVLEVITDNDRSAYNGRIRDGYVNLRAKVTAGDLDVVVAWHTDRLWRSVIDQQLFLADARAAGLALVATCSGDVDPDSGDGTFVATLMAAVAEKESADKGRRIARRHTDKAAAGEFSGGQRAFGYNATHTSIVDVEADEIRAAAQRVLDGIPVGAIAQDWNSRGVTTTRGNRWTTTSVGRLLAQPRLAGLREHKGEIVAKATWPPILDEITWRRLSAIRSARARGPSGRRARRHLLTGLLRCGRCGCPLTTATMGGSVRYRCRDRAHGGCGGVVIAAEFAEAVAVSLLGQRIASPEFVDVVDQARSEVDAAGSVAVALIAQLEVARAQLQQLEDEVVGAEITPTEWLRVRRRARDHVDQIEAKLTRVAAPPVTVVPATFDELASRWEAMPIDEKRQQLAAVIDHVVVHPAQRPYSKPDPNRLQPIWVG